jgi:hypothetical protein
MKEEITNNRSRAMGVGALTTLGSFAHTDQKRTNGGEPVGYSGQIALRREQCSR